MDFQGCGNNSDKKHHELNNKTVGKYFVEDVLPFVIENVNDQVNVEYLNRNFQYREIARSGNQSLKIQNCNECKKVCDKDKAFNCSCCKTLTYLDCLPKKMDKNALILRAKCDRCLVEPFQPDVNNIEEIFYFKGEL